MTIKRFRTSLSPMLAVVMACTLGPAPLLATSVALAAPDIATGTATFTGQVLQADGKTPQPGVTVILVRNPDSPVQTEFKAGPTDQDGAFRIEGAPTGAYSLLIDTAEGAFVAAESIVLNAGINPRQLLTLRHAAPDGTPGAGQSLGDVTWGQWLIAGAIVVAAAVVAAEVTDDVEEPASPF